MESTKHSKHLINREISWLHFNHRVLQEASNKSVPLLERLRFLGIYSNNLDEFYRVRVATLRRLSEMNQKYFSAIDKPVLVLKKINQMTALFQAEFETIFKTIVLELKDEKISLVNEDQLNDIQKQFVFDFYRTKLIDSISPIFISRTKEFPEIGDAKIYLAIQMESDNDNHEYALIEVPTSDFSRFLVLPSSDKTTNIILLDDVIRLCIPDIFQSLNYSKFEAYTIKITRDAEIDSENDFGDSLINKVSKGVKNRRLGSPVRFVYDAAMHQDMLKFILKQLKYKKSDSIIPGGRYHNFKDFMSFPSVGEKKLVYPKLPPLKKHRIELEQSVIVAAEKQDLFLHYPYFGFSQYVQLLREAAIDPNVKSIKITLYRVASNSKVIRALINAARNGKDVTAVVEVRARFDEEHNIEWANKMQETGIKVVFGIEGLKIHSKLTLIKRKTNSIAAISTGNFHEGNAAVYTDFTLITSNKKIVSEVDEVFGFINTPYQSRKYNHLLVSPYDMRKKIVAFINKEIQHAQKGLPAFIHCKINHICDNEIIFKLYEAAKEGVDVKLIVRGMCSMQPPKELKNTIEIISIVDRFLEHSRIFIFCNNNRNKYYISSADWMIRNLDHRIETAVPIYDSTIQKELRRIIDYGLKDNSKSRIVDGLGKNTFKSSNEKTFCSQVELYNHYKTENNEY